MKRSKPKGVLLASSMAGLTLMSPNAPFAANSCRPLSVGIGAQIWPEDIARHADVAGRLKDFGATDIRFSAGPAWGLRQDTPTDDKSDQSFDDFVATQFAKTPGWDSTRTFLAGLSDTPGLRLHLVVWQPPRLSHDAPGIPPGGVHRALKTEDVLQAAKFLVANIAFMQRASIKVDYLELTNEPDGDWDIRIVPEIYLALIEHVRGEAARRKIALPKILGPGTSTVAAATAYLEDPRFGPEIMKRLDGVSVHAWDEKYHRDPAPEIKKVHEFLADGWQSKPLIVTEFGWPNAGKDGAKMQPDRGKHLRQVMSLLESGANRVLVWEFQTPAWNNADYGLVDKRGDPTQEYYSLKGIEQVAAESGSCEVKENAPSHFSLTNAADDKISIQIDDSGVQIKGKP